MTEILIHEPKVYKNRGYTYTYDPTYEEEYNGDDPNTQLFGYFECTGCAKKWQSAFAWVNETQDCKDCKISISPYKLYRKKVLKHASFHCQECNNRWNDYIYIIRDMYFEEQQSIRPEISDQDQHYYDDGEYYEEENNYIEYDYGNNYYDEEYNYRGYYADWDYYEDENNYKDYYGDVRYDLAPQMCSCGNLVHPVVNDYDSGVPHKKHLCSRCRKVGKCSKSSIGRNRRNRSYQY